MSTGNAQTAQATAEHAWGFMHEGDDPPKEPEVERKTLSYEIDALKEWRSKVERDINRVVEVATAITMKTRPDGSPEDYASDRPQGPVSRDDLERIVRSSSRLGAMEAVQFIRGGDYHEAPKPQPKPQNNRTLYGILLTGAGAIATSIYFGSIAMGNRMTAVEVKMDATAKAQDVYQTNLHEWQSDMSSRVRQLEERERR